ncbi:sensor histidine kinase [Vulgatibacter sp.]|uniref:sensor histidine kinase n=1 Tax=Vulgatibacter sp. TaxID=1971226 RepID=UPI00356ADBB1
MEISASLPIAGDERPQSLHVARAERMAWLVRLRWAALASVLAGAVAAPWLGITEIDHPVLFGALAAGVAFNGWILWGLRRHPEKVGEPLLHALPDFGALTLVLWSTGGVDNPFVSLFFVHVLLVSVLSGRRSGLLACAVALFCAAFLSFADLYEPLRLSSYTPDPRWVSPLQSLAFVVTLLASAWVADRAATELSLRRREAEAARRALRRDAEILLAALDRLEVGVEILQPDGTPSFRNRHLLERRDFRTDCPRDSQTCETINGGCPVEEARQGRTGTCRFAVMDRGGRERVIELLSFPLSEARPAPVLRLHLDRTENVLAERKLLFAERLASLGRTVQAVAHELNTPLATIQTLAADMRAALQGAPPEAEALARDLDESALVILDEMRRCREITQGLLGGRDQLSGNSSQGPTVAGDAIRRAATLVFGTGVARSRLEVAPELAALSVAMAHDALVQVFVNLLQNAADVIEGKPAGKVRVGVLPAAPGLVRLFVDDDGPGLSPGTRDRVFEAFYTTKPPGKGTGLGLYTARSLVREAGGSLDLADAPGGGARALLDLPAGGTTS